MREGYRRIFTSIYV